MTADKILRRYESANRIFLTGETKDFVLRAMEKYAEHMAVSYRRYREFPRRNSNERLLYGKYVKLLKRMEK